MPDFQLIDCHVHCFPSFQDGTEFMVDYLSWGGDRMGILKELIEARTAAGHAHTNILMYTPTTFYFDRLTQAGTEPEEARRQVIERQARNNTWACDLVRRESGLGFFCGVDCTRMSEEEMLAEVERCIAGGAAGVKIVFSGLGIFGDDPRLRPLYDYCQSRSIPILAQSSGRAGATTPAYARAEPFGRMATEFPRLKLILAHLAHFPDFPNGGLDELAQAMEGHPNLCADLSLRLDAVARGEWSPEGMVEAIRRLGPEHILFGTNFPLGDPVAATRVFWELPLTAAERRMIGRENFLRLVGA